MATRAKPRSGSHVGLAHKADARLQADRSDNGSAYPAPALVSWLYNLRCYLSEDLFGGPRLLNLSTVINIQKGSTFLFLGLLIWYYQNSSPAAWIYLSLHGSYGLVWLLKEATFPDLGWRRPATVAGAVMAFVGTLGLYWLIGWLLISRTSTPVYPLPDPVWFALCISLHTLGCVIMVASDAQKYFTLQLQKGLITSGLFARVRHPNYLGEMMLYGCYALLCWHWLPFAILGYVWTVLFAVNMSTKEASMSRHPGWAEYKRRTWWLVPWLL